MGKIKLANNGLLGVYAAASSWQVDDVRNKFKNVDDETCQEVLDIALTDDMITFDDLLFKDHFRMINAHHVFDNNWKISVSAGSGSYCTPRKDLKQPELFSSFEVAIFNPNGDFATKDLFQADDDVVGWCNRDDIDDIIAMIITQ